MRFILELRQGGITDPRVLQALERTPRGHFAPPEFSAMALDDVAFPIPCGQSMTKTSVIARAVVSLGVERDHSVLEIGAGSGFQTGVLALLARRVVSVERYRTLAAYARERLGRLRLMHAFVHVADGLAGFPAEAPFDRIVVNAALPGIPPALVDQLKPGGVMVAPVGISKTQLMRFRKTDDDGLTREALDSAAFLPIESGIAQAL
jgi:protein-L-isoaspartate(D-aspartate) O-methyltransferase